MSWHMCRVWRIGGRWGSGYSLVRGNAYLKFNTNMQLMRIDSGVWLTTGSWVRVTLHPGDGWSIHLTGPGNSQLLTPSGDSQNHHQVSHPEVTGYCWNLHAPTVCHIILAVIPVFHDMNDIILSRSFTPSLVWYLVGEEHLVALVSACASLLLYVWRSTCNIIRGIMRTMGLTYLCMQHLTLVLISGFPTKNQMLHD